MKASDVIFEFDCFFSVNSHMSKDDYENIIENLKNGLK